MCVFVCVWVGVVGGGVDARLPQQNPPIERFFLVGFLQ